MEGVATEQEGSGMQLMVEKGNLVVPSQSGRSETSTGGLA